MTDTTDPTPDPPLTLDLVKALIEAGVKAGLGEAAAAVPVPTIRPGVVQGVTAADRTASVLLDGDSAAVTAQVICELPYPNARVMVEFVPPSAVFVIGFVGSCGVPPGSLQAYAGAVTADAGAAATSATPGEPPAGWLWCHGQNVSRSTYSALFAAISTTHGVGDGTTTFAVPDYRGRGFLGLDNMGGSDAGRISAANTLGGSGGSNTISQAMLPNVTLSLSGGTVSGTTSSDGSHQHSYDHNSGGASGATGADFTAGVGSATLSTFGADGAHTHTFSGSLSGGTASLGGSGSEHLPPYLLCHVLIKC